MEGTQGPSKSTRAFYILFPVQSLGTPPPSTSLAVAPLGNLYFKFGNEHFTSTAVKQSTSPQVPPQVAGPGLREGQK
jgi:hypothetical protein